MRTRQGCVGTSPVPGVKFIFHFTSSFKVLKLRSSYFITRDPGASRRQPLSPATPPPCRSFLTAPVQPVSGFAQVEGVLPLAHGRGIGRDVLHRGRFKPQRPYSRVPAVTGRDVRVAPEWERRGRREGRNKPSSLVREPP